MSSSYVLDPLCNGHRNGSGVSTHTASINGNSQVISDVRGQFWAAGRQHSARRGSLRLWKVLTRLILACFSYSGLEEEQNSLTSCPSPAGWNTMKNEAVSSEFN